MKTWHADGVTVRYEHGTTVAVCRQAKPLTTMIASDNALFIAAAPDLFAVCKAIANCVGVSSSEERFGELVSEQLDSLNAAIAKAETGGTS